MTEISIISDFADVQVKCASKLISRLKDCNQENLHESVLSGLFCFTLQDIFRLFRAADGIHQCLLHQKYIPGSGAASADITIMDMDTNVTSVLSLLNSIGDFWTICFQSLKHVPMQRC